MRVGPYEVLEQLGQGGAGVVYRARDPALGREVALKVLRSHRQGSRDARERFQREAQALGRLRHPNVVTVHAAGEHDGTPYLAMELIAGETLQQRLRSGPLPAWEAVDLVAQVADGVAHAHDLGVLHRDIKPDNIIIGADGVPRLTDLGLAKASGVDRTLSKTGVLLGTPGFWSPEQAQGAVSELGPPADVYGLGATLYAALTGRPPIEADTMMAAIVATLERPVTPPSKLVDGVDRRLDAICLRALAKDPAERYPTARALAEALRQGEAPARRRWAPLGAVGLLGVVLVALALAHLGRSPDPAAASSPSASAPPQPPAVTAAPTPTVTVTVTPTPTPDPALRERQRRQQERVKRLLAEAQMAITLRSFAAARTAATQALELDPRSAMAHFIRGDAWQREQRYEPAIKDYAAGLAIAPRHPVGNFRMGHALIQFGRFEEAVTHLNVAAKGLPRSAGVLYRRSRAYVGLKQLDRALRDAERAVELMTPLDNMSKLRANVAQLRARVEEQRKTPTPGR